MDWTTQVISLVQGRTTGGWRAWVSDMATCTVNIYELKTSLLCCRLNVEVCPSETVQWLTTAHLTPGVTKQTKVVENLWQ